MTAGDIIVISENAFGRKGNYYDGTDDYVLHDAHAVARQVAADTEGTYTAWVYLNDIAGTYTILSAGDNSVANEFFELTSVAGKLQGYLKDSTDRWKVIETTASLTARKWTHVAIVQTGVRPILYVDGEAVVMTDTVSTDLTDWYAELQLVDKFALGVKEVNATHTQDLLGAIGQVKYFSIALSADQIKTEWLGGTQTDARLAAALQLNVTYENDGTTDSGLGADNGVLTGGAIYGGEISDWSYKINNNVTGHAAEFINTLDIGQGRFLTLIKRGD